MPRKATHEPEEREVIKATETGDVEVVIKYSTSGLVIIKAEAAALLKTRMQFTIQEARSLAEALIWAADMADGWVKDE